MSTMTTAQRFPDPTEFGAAIGALVGRDAVGATMVSHVLAGQLADPYPGGPPLMVAVRLDGVVALAALQTQRHPVLVVLDPAVTEPGDVRDALVGILRSDADRVTGFTGRTSTVLPLAQSWTVHTGAGCSVRMTTLFYRLTTLVQPSAVPGHVRPAVLTDGAELDLLSRWLDHFGQETGVGRGLPAPDREMVLTNAKRGQVSLLWCVDGVPVALAGHSTPRNGVARIAPVYTPPEQRRRGYGAAVTAAAVHSARAMGATEVTLFADLDYPPANAVYRGLGFEAIAEFTQVECSAVR